MPLLCRFYGEGGQLCSVEELALEHYAGQEGGGWKGLHCEGGVWVTLFGLLMWDVLFAGPLPGVLTSAHISLLKSPKSDPLPALNDPLAILSDKLFGCCI